MNRRQAIRSGLICATGLPSAKSLIASEKASLRDFPVDLPGESDSAGLAKGDIYELLGFATMSGEDPVRMWRRLNPVQQWRVGPIAPNSWSGCIFVADDADIFGFRTLSLPQAWMERFNGGSRSEYCAGLFDSWWQSWAGREVPHSAGDPGWWKRVGPKAPDNSYAELVWQMPDGGPEVTYEFARTDQNEVVGRFIHSEPADLVVQAYVPWDNDPPRFAVLYSDGPRQHLLRGRAWTPGTRDGMRFSLAFSANTEDTVGVGTGRWHGYFAKLKTLYFCGRQGQRYAELEEKTRAWLENGRIDTVLQQNRQRYLSTRPRGTGWLAEAPDGITNQLEWSEVYTPSRRRSYVSVSRKWAQANNSAPDFLWDSFFNGLLVCQEDEPKAFGMIRDITSWQNDQGMFCQYGQWVTQPDRWIFPVAWGHSQYPIGSLLVSKIYLRRPDQAFLKEIYPRLLKNHRWWFADRGDGQPWRDGNKNGLLELGSNYPEEIPYQDREQTAYFESGDDSPEWWHVARYNNHTQTLEQDTVERNCLYAMDCWILAWIAQHLGQSSDAEALTAEHRRMVATINRLLWDPSRRCYYNRRWEDVDGDPFFPQMGPDIFLSLLGKVANSQQERALRRLFHDPKKFAGEWILPTISRDNPLFSEQDYWRGKVWPPINWLVYQGLKIYEWDHEARLLAESSAKMFLNAWREKGECHENFSAITGEGTGQSDPHYTWGALMALIAIEELVDINPWQGLRFGNLDPVAPAVIERYPVAGSSYDVEQSPKGLEIRRDGQLLFAADGPAEIRQVEFRGREVSYELRCTKPVRLRVRSQPPRAFTPGLWKEIQ